MRRVLLLTVVFLAIAAPAFAHVEVSPKSAPKGGSTTLTFNVEDERDNANEVTVEFYFPDGVTADDIKPSAPAGWDSVFTVSPGSVRFTHAAPGPDGDQSFTLALTNLPNTDELVWKTIVTYDNGDVDRWIDLQTGSKEPPHPAAVVKLTGAASTATTVADHATATTLKRADKTNKGGIAAVIVVAVVVVGGLIAFATRGRRRAA
ncbi:MAG: hypothetical protein QOK28_1350 [Actinomycetota bacterium]|jgi:uncharacterized protein YcnI